MDKGVFWNHVNPLQERLFKFAYSMLKNREDAQDSVHDVLEKLWYKRNHLRWEENLNAFAMRTMKNHCIDTLRKRKQLLNVDAEDTTIQADIPNENFDMVELIKTRIGLLPLEQRMVIELKDIQGYSYQEIGEIMEMPIPTLRVYLGRARKFVIKTIENER